MSGGEVSRRGRMRIGIGDLSFFSIGFLICHNLYFLLAWCLHRMA